MNLDRLLRRGVKLTRDAFLYLEPNKDNKNFAQCSTCAFLLSGDACAIMRRRVSPDASCGMYVEGKTIKEPIASYSPGEVGYIETKVRCENCKWSNKDSLECGLFKKLNTQLPQDFDLDTRVIPKGCCNAFQKS